jgi:hypothetical protein
MTSYLKTNYQAPNLFKIYKEILEWDFTLLKGKGLVARCTGSDAYAHIELTIQKSDEEYNSKINWNVSEFQVPNNLGHKPVIEDTLTYFTNYLSGIKGEIIALKYEITNIGFCDVDTQFKHYAEATMIALIDSFDKTLYPFNDKRLKGTSLHPFYYTDSGFFLKSEIMESLKNKQLSDILFKVFNRENMDIKVLNRVTFSSYINDNFQIRKSLLTESEVEILRTSNAISKYDYITDIGKAHVAKNLKTEYLLYYCFDIKFEDFNN